MKLWPKIAAPVLALALSGCVNGEFQGGAVFDTILERTGVREAETEKVEVPQTEQPPLIVGYGAARVAIPFNRESGRSRVYLAPDGVEIAMMDGLVTRSEGIGLTLLSAYFQPDSFYDGDGALGERLSRGAERRSIANRTLDYWKKGRVRRDEFLCVLTGQAAPEGSVAARVVDETCKRYFDDEGFRNRYWIDDSGAVVCSRQVFHPEAAPLQFFANAELATSKDLVSGGC